VEELLGMPEELAVGRLARRGWRVRWRRTGGGARAGGRLRVVRVRQLAPECVELLLAPEMAGSGREDPQCSRG
jgi:hypothetical protein